jgi:hypothetical protein
MARGDVDTGALKYVINHPIRAAQHTSRDGLRRKSHPAWRIVEDLAILSPDKGGTY